MREKSYIKVEKELQDIIESDKRFHNAIKSVVLFLFQRKRTALIALICVLLLPAFLICKSIGNSDKYTADDIEISSLADMPISASMTSKSVITIPSGIAKANPFVPYREITKARTSKANDLPAFTLVEPPESVNENSDAARVMDTIVSGILYDKFSPSAILNIEGNDYLVKKGDVVNNYKVLDILQDSVTVKLGANVYKAGIGEILTEGTVNKNTVSNLGNKFGGAR